MFSIVLINPNTSESTTTMMVEIAQAEAGERAVVTGWTARFGAPLITDEAALQVGADAVVSLAHSLSLSPPDGVVVAAFGDPGLEHARSILSCPITGIAEAAMLEAALSSTGAAQRFSVVTTTPQLADRITRSAMASGLADRFTGVRVTCGDLGTLMAHPEALVKALRFACQQAIEQDGAQALIIGGGPLARAARVLRPHFTEPIIEPIPAAIRLALRRSGARKDRLA